MKTGKKGGKDKLFNFRPILFTAIALIFGIVFYYFRRFHGVSMGWLFLLIPMVGTPFFFCHVKRDFIKTAVAWAVLLLFFFIGYGAFSSQVQAFSKPQVESGKSYVVGRVVEKNGNEYATRLLLDNVFVDGEEVDGKLNAYLPASFYENAKLGDEILLFGDLRVDTNLFSDYGLRANKIGDDIRFSLSAEEYTLTGKDFDLCLTVRERIHQVVHAGMDEDSAAVMMAVLTGDTSGMDDGLLDNMRRGGIAHIFAVSGLHVGALYAFCLLLLQKTVLIRLPKICKFGLLAALLLFYGGVCGFSASIIRATVLCLVAYAVKLFASSLDFLEILGFAAIVVLLLSPVALFEVGFQLSFLACLGIALLQRRLGQVCVEIGKAYRKRFPRKLTPAQEKMVADGDTLPLSVGERFARSCANVVTTSLASQIATLPILLNAFGYISGWSLLLNVVFVPLVSAVFAVLLLLVAVACVLPIGWSVYVLYLPNVAWSLILLLFETVDFSTFALVGWQMSPQAQLAYYGGCLFTTDKWNLTKKWAWSCAGGCFAVFLLLFLVGNL